jgi:arylsulfatase A-like enzyme
MEMGAAWMNKTIVWNGIIHKRWKYVYWACEQREELFDLKNDPNEMLDMSGSRSDLVSLYR